MDAVASMRFRAPSLLLALSVAWSLPSSANLLKDGDVNVVPLSPEFRIWRSADQGRVSQYEEDLYWNRAVRLEIVSTGTTPSGERHVHTGLLVGGDGKKPGFACKPDTEYEFSFELRGEAARLQSDFDTWDASGRPSLGKTSLSGIVPGKEWRRYTGVFKTPPGAVRAALEFAFWGRGGDFREKVGDWVLIDKVDVHEKRKSVLSREGAEAPELKLADAVRHVVCVLGGGAAEKLSPLVDARVAGHESPYPADISASADESAVVFDCRFRSTPAVAGPSGGKSRFWSNDTLEFFFKPPVPGARVDHYAVCASGERWMPDASRLGAWSAKTLREGDGWRTVVRIPWKTLGYAGMPPAERPVRFNLAYAHFVGAYNEAAGLDAARENRRYDMDKTVFDSVWSFCRGEYRNMSAAGWLFTGPVEAYAKGRLAALTQDAVKAIAKDVSWNDPGLLVGQLEMLSQADRELRLAAEPFIVAQVPPHVDTAIPFMPDEINDPGDAIRGRGAVNDRVPLVAAVANTRKDAEQFRLQLSCGWREQLPGNDMHYPRAGLARADGTLFPPERISIMNGVMYRDADTAVHGVRYDPLEPLGATGSLLVPPKESGLVWIEFDCRGAKPGVYRGKLLVTPLAHGRKVSMRIDRKGGFPVVVDDSKEIDVELEVLPFELPEPFAMPLQSYKSGFSDCQRRFMDDAQSTFRIVSPWFFGARFDESGNLVERKPRAFLRDFLAKSAASPKYANIPRVMICYSAGSVFRRAFAPKGAKEGSAVYWKAYRAWLRYVDETLAAGGIGRDDYSIEIMDEPQKKYIPTELLVSYYREARAALPDSRLLITHGEEDFYDDVKDLVDDWIFSHHSCGNAAESAKIADWGRRKAAFSGRRRPTTSLYACGTNMRQSHYGYYRLLPWKAHCIGADYVSIYQLYEQQPGVSLRAAQYGSLVYDSGAEIIPSTRFKNLMNGMRDVRYLRLLASLASGGSPAAAEARRFLAGVGRSVAYEGAHDAKLADAARERTVDFILKLKGTGDGTQGRKPRN